jgi:hypothetical protein
MNDVIIPPRPPGTPWTQASWTVMEARLVTAKVHDLLDDAAVRLERLRASEDLTAEVADSVTHALQALEVGRDSIRSARNSLTRR